MQFILFTWCRDGYASGVSGEPIPAYKHITVAWTSGTFVIYVRQEFTPGETGFASGPAPSLPQGLFSLWSNGADFEIAFPSWLFLALPAIPYFFLALRQRHQRKMQQVDARPIQDPTATFAG